MSEFVPFGKGRKSFTFGSSNVAPGISVLMSTGNPFAVFWSVIAKMFVAFDFMGVRRRFTHVGKEVFKFPPSFADSNAFGSVKLVGIADRGGVATFQHPLPDSIDSGSAHAVRSVGFSCGAASGLLFGRFGFPLASTVSRNASSEVGSVNPCSVSAPASTEPKRAVAASIRSWNGFMWPGDSPEVENLICSVNKRFTHMFYITDEKRLTKGVLWPH